MPRAKRDVVVTNHGSIVTFALRTRKARRWVSDHIPDDAQWFGGQLAVEPRYAGNVIDGMEGDGLAVA